MIKTGKCKVWVPVPGLFLIFVLLVPVLILLGYHMASRPHVLLVREVNSGRELRVGYLNQGEKFEIRYIHSVDRLPVYEEFQLINGELVLTGTRFLSFGAGLGYTGEGLLRGEGKWNIIEGMYRRVDSLPLRVGTIADHTLLYRGREIHLGDHFDGQALVRIEVK
ncbi:DUF1850 domain-containing protein [Desulfofundulus sp. TPOSR]|uniref:DUF1850 domain-containing protein n=1 Tax=Desulfofundulus sp. TPOSR TaxID=2714340 RepID=UPI001408CDDB|nr:DUF1850 domain-containing protein [Desulfofundulus sp. TPOSR]NHM27375.1 DUF1850 domain-containing protein [Desulfofundulus sp. TPOSR]